MVHGINQQNTAEMKPRKCPLRVAFAGVSHLFRTALDLSPSISRFQIFLSRTKSRRSYMNLKFHIIPRPPFGISSLGFFTLNSKNKILPLSLVSQKRPAMTPRALTPFLKNEESADYILSFRLNKELWEPPSLLYKYELRWSRICVYSGLLFPLMNVDPLSLPRNGNDTGVEYPRRSNSGAGRNNFLCSSRTIRYARNINSSCQERL